jgi:hypothetical protein
MTDTEIKIRGMEALFAQLGEIETERFISLILREPFDYTRWQRKLWQDKSVEDISKMAMQNRNSQE